MTQPRERRDIAHERESDKAIQTVAEHLRGVSGLARKFASKIGLELAGELLGLLHDLGKYSNEFQTYIQSATERISPDEDDYVDVVGLRGKIDHSTAGAQFIWQELGAGGALERFLAQVLSLAIASHHSGLIDVLAPDGTDQFRRRIEKNSEKTHFDEVCERAEPEVLSRARQIMRDTTFVARFKQVGADLFAKDLRGGLDPLRNDVSAFKFGLLVRFLFSCLIDADRVDTADFENPRAALLRNNGSYPAWAALAERLEKYLATLGGSNSPVNLVRAEVAQRCLKRATDPQGLFTLTVPTGGGKTLASLRFALRHAQHHQLDRVIFILPYTSIIDQNAQVVREILEDSNPQAYAATVLEHHSNLLPERESWRGKILAENWDAPVVYTTMVQFLEALFAGGTRGARRHHQLARSVLVFDEIQTLPIRCVHIFCNAVNFLVENCRTTALLCTATQPLLGDLPDTTKGGLKLGRGNEIVADVPALFAKLKRVNVVDRTRPEGWTTAQLVDLARGEVERAGSCLIIVNTKRAAQELYCACKAALGYFVYHLSTSMCPAHRLRVLAEVRQKLGRESLICVSTQLIEAGVDLDFGGVVRFAAGMDSVAQAAGRCNRHGHRAIGNTYIVNPVAEVVDQLPDIAIGKEKTLRLLSEFRKDPGELGGDLLHPEVMKRYFRYYFFDRAEEMSYKIGMDELGREDTLLNLLATNRQVLPQSPCFQFEPSLRQSFATAGRAFRAVDAPTTGLIVPYGEEGKRLIAALSSAFDVEKETTLLRRAQRFTVNAFPNVIRQLENEQALAEVKTGTGIRFVSERFYHEEYGLCTSTTGVLDPQVV